MTTQRDNPQTQTPDPVPLAAVASTPAAVPSKVAPMRISELRVENFRSIANETFTFHSFAALIGKNNSGKSNVLAAIAFLLEGTAKNISIRDFHSPSVSVVISATLSGVRAYLPLLSPEHRKKIDPCVISPDIVRIRKVASPDGSGCKLEIWQPDKEDFGTPTGIDAGLKQLVPEVILVDAFVDPTDEAQSKQGATLGKILSAILEDVRRTSEHDLKQSMAQANKLLNVVDDGTGNLVDDRALRLKDIESALSLRIGQSFNGASARLKVDLPKVPELLAGARIELSDGGDWTEPRLKGQGQQRALYVSLLLTLADEKRKNGTGAVSRPFVLLVEEPEAFLHPSAQGDLRRALESLSESNQVIISTHSPAMIVPSRLTDAVLIRKVVHPGARPVTEKLNSMEAQIAGCEKRIRHLLEYGRSSQFLFADAAVVVEGVSDAELVDAIAFRLDGLAMADRRVACIDAQNKTTVKPCMDVLASIGLRVYGLVDLDFLWRGAGDLLGGNPIYSAFMERFWKACEAASIVALGKRDISGAKKDEACRLASTTFAADIAGLSEYLQREHFIWMLKHGEIEHYVGLSSSSKGEFSKAANEIRAGSRPLVHDDELRALLAWLVV